MTKRMIKAEERRQREAEWQAAEARRTARGDMFSALPDCAAKAVLWAEMVDRCVELFNASKFEEGDAILEFLPNDYARKLLDWYFDHNDENPPFPTPPTPAEYEAAQPGQIQDQPQQPGGTHRDGSSEADAEIVSIAGDLVALWENPTIKGLPRAERNAAIEETRNRLIAAVAQR